MRLAARPVVPPVDTGKAGGWDVSEPALDALIRHPNFERALMGVAKSAVEQYRASWILNRILSDRGRMVSALVALDLHYAVGDRTGFSLVRLREEAARHGFASPGRVTAWAATMRLLGFLAPGAAGPPQRVVPTQKFFAMFRDRLGRNWQSIALLHPPAHQAIALLEDDTFLAHLPAGFMSTYRNGQRVFDAIPELASIADREGGMCILFSVMLRDAAGEAIAVAPLAREFTVSRAHVRSILQAMEAMGMLARPRADSDYRLEPRFKVWVSRFVAALFQHHIYAMDRALARCPARAAGAEETGIPAVPSVPTPALGGTISPRPLP